MKLNIITAKEACSGVLTQEEIDQNKLYEIEATIWGAMREGRYHVNLERELTLEQNKLLKAVGYTVHYNSYSAVTQISWLEAAQELKDGTD